MFGNSHDIKTTAAKFAAFARLDRNALIMPDRGFCVGDLLNIISKESGAILHQYSVTHITRSTDKDSPIKDGFVVLSVFDLDSLPCQVSSGIVELMKQRDFAREQAEKWKSAALDMFAKQEPAQQEQAPRQKVVA